MKLQVPISGFTLLEMIVSLGMFSVLIIASIGVILGVSRAQTKTANLQTIQDNIRFSMELITRELRTGSDYSLTTFCAPLGLERARALLCARNKTFPARAIAQTRPW
ncbi:MAG: hypothetical protein HYT39_02760 [Candidatus Sungbacteria bacterium]|nr:hypothetical protein [Candidatus Sungbacteria bacterium]